MLAPNATLIPDLTAFEKKLLKSKTKHFFATPTTNVMS